MLISISGSDEQKKRFLAPFLTCKGTPLAALGFSEPTGSANWLQNEGGKGVQTIAKIDGGDVVINGGKIWASSSGGVSINDELGQLLILTAVAVGFPRSGAALPCLSVWYSRGAHGYHRHCGHYKRAVR